MKRKTKSAFGIFRDGIFPKRALSLLFQLILCRKVSGVTNRIIWHTKPTKAENRSTNGMKIIQAKKIAILHAKYSTDSSRQHFLFLCSGIFQFAKRYAK